MAAMRSAAALPALLGLTLLTGACASSGAVPRPFPGAAAPPQRTADATGTPAPPPSPSPAARAEDEPAAAVVHEPVGAPPTLAALLETALGFRGVPYRNGGADPALGFDCSGFVLYVFAQHGRQLPREVQAQYRIGTPVDRDEVRPGDLVFFETVSRGASHVGIALGGGEFVHAPSSRGVVRTERYTVDYWARRWVGARRLE